MTNKKIRLSMRKENMRDKEKNTGSSMSVRRKNRKAEREHERSKKELNSDTSEMKRKEIIERAKTLQFLETDRVKGFKRAELMSQVLKEREAQIELKKRMKIQDKKEQDKISAMMRQDRELALLEERRKSEDRRQKRLDHAEFLRQQIKERGLAKETELMEMTKETEKRKHFQDQYEKEQTMLKQMKRDKKRNIKKAYEEHLATKKIIQSSEVEKQELEKEKRKLFVEAKDKQIKLWKEKEAERFRDVQRLRDIVADRLTKSLTSKNDHEDEMIARAVAEAVAKRDKEEHEKEEKKAAMLRNIAQHREAKRKELQHKKQKEKEEAAEWLKARKAADLHHHETQKLRAQKRREEAKLLQDSYLQQMVRRQKGVLPDHVNKQQDHLDKVEREHETSHLRSKKVKNSSPKTLARAKLMAEVLKEREAQIELKKRMKAEAKEEEEKISAMMRRNRELALLEERRKSEDRRQKRLDHAEFLRQQIKERGLAKETELMEMTKETEKRKHFQDQYEKEQTMLKQTKQDKKRNIKKAYEEHLATKKIIQSSEVEKQELEKEKRKLFVEAKDKQIKLWKEKEAERSREFQRLRDIVADRLSESLKAKNDDEDEMIAKAVAEAMAKNEKEQREKDEKKAAMLRNIAQHREAKHKELQHKKQKEKEEAAEWLKTRKAADLHHHETQKLRAQKRREEAKLIQDSYLQQMVRRQKGVLPDHVNKQQDHLDKVEREHETSHLRSKKVKNSSPKTLARAKLMAEVLKEREAQIELKKRMKAEAKEEEEKISAMIRKDRELALLEERRKSEDRRQKRLDHAEFLRKQIKERGLAKETELMEMTKETEKRKHFQDQYEKEQTMLKQTKQDKKRNIKKAYEEHLATKKIIQSSEVEKQELEKEKRKLFVEAKDKQIKLWKEKEAERSRDVQRLRDIVADRLSESLKAKNDDEDEMIAKAVAEAVAKNDKEQREKDEKKAAMLKNIAQHREAKHKELQHKKQKEKEEAAERLKAKKAADLHHHETQKLRAQKRREEAKLIQDSYDHQMDEKHKKKQLMKKEKQENKMRNAQLIEEEEAQFQTYATGVIETARKDQRNTSLLKKASRVGIGGGHGPVFDGIRPSYRSQDKSGSELPNYIRRKNLDLKTYMTESRKRLGFRH